MGDQFVALSMAAAATKKLKLATGICLVPEHNPMILAKQIGSLDNFSGGRFIFGIGAGWLREETELLGGDFPHRWTQTAEYVAAMRALWTKGEASFEGKYVKFPAIRFVSAPRAAGRTAGTARQPRQERAQARRQVGRRMVPDSDQRRRDETGDRRSCARSATRPAATTAGSTSP